MFDFSELIGELATFGVAGLMFAMGLTLKVQDFLRVVRFPKAVFLGLLGQIVLLPLIGFGLAKLFRLSPDLALGLMIIAACPGGSTSNAFSFMARADVALSITLTAVSAILAFLTVPIIINLSIAHFGYGAGEVRLDFVDAAVRVFLTTALPVLSGLTVRAMAKAGVERLVRPLFFLSLTAILLPSGNLLVEYREVFVGDEVFGASSAALLNVIMLALGFFIGTAARLPTAQAKTISLEVGLQNFGLVVVIVYVFLDDARLLVPGVIYLPTMLITGLVAARFFSRMREPDGAHH